jgi:uncharacterized protein
MNRRQFVRAAIGSACASAFAGTCYGFFESSWITINEAAYALPRLPDSFRGTKVAFLTDLHHGPYTDISYVESIVRTTNLLQPDVILLGGDYSLRDAMYIGPAFEALAHLRAPLGVHGVLGNHDYWQGHRQTLDGFRSARITDLTNTAIRITRGGESLVLAGVDDLWRGEPDAQKALKTVRPGDATLFLSHNPDYAETLDPEQAAKIGLVLSGHTHGGQVVFPGGLAPFVPSRYGSKYMRGWVDAPGVKVLVSRGLGTSMLPVRVGSRPEIHLITLI